MGLFDRANDWIMEADDAGEDFKSFSRAAVCFLFVIALVFGFIMLLATAFTYNTALGLGVIGCLFLIWVIWASLPVRSD